jgi:hypothetical protein
MIAGLALVVAAGFGGCGGGEKGPADQAAQGAANAVAGAANAAGDAAGAAAGAVKDGAAAVEQKSE